MIKTLPEAKLAELVIKPTLFCYHKCPYCHLRQTYYDQMLDGAKATARDRDGLTRPGNMPLDLAIRSINDGAAMGMTSLLFSGGDPLLYPHLTELVQAGARHPGVFVYMNSVGTHVTEAKVRELLDAGLAAWNFSVDTLDEMKYARLRGLQNALPTIMDAIRTVRRVAVSYPEFCINYMCAITQENFRDLPALLSHCLETDVASMYLMNVYGDTTGAHLLSESDIKKFRSDVVPEMLEVIANAGRDPIVLENARSVLGSFFSPDNSDANYAAGKYWATADDARHACNSPNRYALIEPDGRVLPCCMVEISHQGEVGNVSNRSLGDVWHDDGYTRFRADRIDYCQSCSAPRNKTLGLIPKMCRQFT
jgi:MoaA/NifB/PqqE/SkfB family radical SAM enzyme